MSLYYTHFLIPISPEYRLKPDAMAMFLQGLASSGNIASPHTISFSPVTKNGPDGRKIRNVVTGETIIIPRASRRIEKPQLLSNSSQVVELVANVPEYDLAISAEGIPSAPPFPVGYIENDTWNPMTGSYHLEIRCRVRKNMVRLYSLDSEDELHRPPDITKYRPRFDEDCLNVEREGLFVHPESGVIKIQNAGCGTSWIEFRLGKFIFPRLRDGSVNLLEDSIVFAAQKLFKCDFVQACNWG